MRELIGLKIDKKLGAATAPLDRGRLLCVHRFDNFRLLLNSLIYMALFV